jgi:glycosyltransferase involved in cell wall biosynthesis
MSPRLSVIVRARDEAAGIGRCLQLIGAQRLPGGLETIVVEGGSRDGTAAIAAANGATVVAIDPDAFTFGGALNLGAERARGEILVALSAHAFPRDDGWLARLAAAFDDPRVACASGERFRPDGTPLTAAVEYDAALAARHPTWGYSNAAGAFRAALWRERPFRTDLPACEDREWCRHFLADGYVCVLDPALLVDHDHTHDPVAQIFARARREAAGFAAFLPPEALAAVGASDLRALALAWYSDTRFYDSAWRGRLSHRRAARLLGSYTGLRDERTTHIVGFSSRTGQGGGSSPNGILSTRRLPWIRRR